jgi:mannose/fructose/N-acetylgalactosamine-specific phosphotransferase system component IIC
LTIPSKSLFFTFMQVELALILVLGGLVALDKTEACQTMLSQPLLVGPIVGYLLNDLPRGLTIGALLQLAYLWVLPIGTAVFPDSSTGSVAASYGYLVLTNLFPDRSNLILLLIILFCIPFSLFAGWSLVKQRQLNYKLLRRADLRAPEGRMSRLSALFALGLVGSFARGLAVTGLLKPMARLLDFVPELYLTGVELPIWGLGIGTALYLFGKRRNILWCVLGAAGGAIILML